MPTCIDARVRRLGLKKTRATDLPFKVSELSVPRLNVKAESIIRFKSLSECCGVERKCIFQISEAVASVKVSFLQSDRPDHLGQRINKLIHFGPFQTERRQQPQNVCLTRRTRNNPTLEQGFVDRLR